MGRPGQPCEGGREDILLPALQLRKINLRASFVDLPKVTGLKGTDQGTTWRALDPQNKPLSLDLVGGGQQCHIPLGNLRKTRTKSPPPTKNPFSLGKERVSALRFTSESGVDHISKGWKSTFPAWAQSSELSWLLPAPPTSPPPPECGRQVTPVILLRVKKPPNQ